MKTLRVGMTLMFLLNSVVVFGNLILRVKEDPVAWTIDRMSVVLLSLALSVMIAVACRRNGDRP